MMMMTMRVSSFVLLALLSTMGSNGLEQQQGKCDAGVSAAACAARPEEDDKGTASLPGDDDELDREEEMQLLQAQKKMQSETKSGRQFELSARTTKKARTGASRAGKAMHGTSNGTTNSTTSNSTPFATIVDIMNKTCMALEKDWLEQHVTCADLTIRRNDTRVACEVEAGCVTCEEEEMACTERGEIAQDWEEDCAEEEEACGNNNNNKKAACTNAKAACDEKTEEILQDWIDSGNVQIYHLFRDANATCFAEETTCNEGKEDCVGKKATCDNEADAARQDERDACEQKTACENTKAACKNEEQKCFQEVDASVAAACAEVPTAHNQTVAKCGALNNASAVLEGASLNGR